MGHAVALGQALPPSGSPEASEALLRMHLSHHPGDPEARRLLGEALFTLGRFEEALAEYRTLLDEFPDHPAAHYNWAIHCKRIGRYESAEAGYRRAVELSPHYADAHFNLGNLLLECDRLAEAEAAFGRVLELQPDYLPAWSNLGLVLQRQGRYGAAFEAFRSALAIDPDDSVAGRNLEHLYAHLVPAWHLPMLADSARNAAYDRALRRAVCSTSRVLDIGAGSGLLAMMAARAGAGEVYACEMNEPLSAAAAEVLRINGMAEKVRLVPKKSTRLVLGKELPGPADLLVCEIFDAGLLGEGVLPTLRHALANLAVPTPRLIPARAKVYVSLGSLPRLASAYPLREVAGFDLSALARFTNPQAYQTVRLEGEPHRLLSDPCLAWSVDFADLPAACPANAPNRWNFVVEATGEGTIDALVFWFELELDDTTSITTAPGSDIFHWGQAVQFQVAPRSVQAGERIAVRGEQSDECLGFFLS